MNDTGGYFSVAGASAVGGLSRGAHVHLIGICGVGMAQLACELKRAGFSVSGSDREFYDPMGSLLRQEGVATTRGYDAAHIPSGTALVVVGNSAVRSNPEVLETERRKLPYTFFPRALAELIIAQRHSIAVCGTHGKSTTTALFATALIGAGEDPSYFVGGLTSGLPRSLAAGSGRYAVVEGDEYDSAFFAKRPKFEFYEPRTAIITSIEYDHADIYPSLDAINAEFTKLVTGIPAAGHAVCCSEGDNLRELTARWRGEARAKIVTYGVRDEDDYRMLETASTGAGGERIRIALPGGRELELTAPVIGRHNALNVTAVIAACDLLGLDLGKIAAVLTEYKGLKRRQEVVLRSDKILISDFAHHPTAVRETVRAVRRGFAGQRLRAVFEPRSNTSRRKVFQEAYAEAFSDADEAVLCKVARREIDPPGLIDVETLAHQIEQRGTPCRALPDPDAIADYLLSTTRAGDVLLIMSNGSFGGLVEKLATKLR